MVNRFISINLFVLKWEKQVVALIYHFGQCNKLKYCLLLNKEDGRLDICKQKAKELKQQLEEHTFDILRKPTVLFKRDTQRNLY